MPLIYVDVHLETTLAVTLFSIGVSEAHVSEACVSEDGVCKISSCEV